MPAGRFLSGSSLEAFEVLMQEGHPCLLGREGQEMAVSCFFCRDTRRPGHQKMLGELRFRIPDSQPMRRVEGTKSCIEGPVYRNREREERCRGLMGHRQILALDQRVSYVCALYLLTVDGYLWDKTRDAITMLQVIFPDIRLGGINVKGYILCHLAKDLYYRAECMKVSDLVDHGLVDQGVFAVLLTGCLLREHGLKRMEQVGMMQGGVAPLNSIIGWIGGKKALRELIYQHFPLSYGRYIEIFGGGGWVLFGKPRGRMEVYNDYNLDLTDLFRCVRDKPLALIQELGFFPLNGREEFDYLKRFLNQEEFMAPGLWYQDEGHLAERCPTPEACREVRPILGKRAGMYSVKRAACFYQLIRYSYGSGCISYECQPPSIRRTLGLLREESRELAGTVVENKDFKALIRQYDREDASFYCDPPYYKTEEHYEVVFHREDHVWLRDALGGIQEKWLLSYSDCAYIRELYEGYQIGTVKRLNSLAQWYNQEEEYAGVFISSCDTACGSRELPGQMELSDVYGFYPQGRRNMRLKELNMKPEADGEVIIPAEVLESVGAGADETIYVTCLAEKDGDGPGVFVDPLGVGELTPDQLYEGGTQLTVPEELLEEAGTQPDEDLEVVFEDRRITVLPTRTGDIVPRGILEPCPEIGIDPEKVWVIMEMGGLDGGFEEDVSNRGQ